MALNNVFHRVALVSIAWVGVLLLGASVRVQCNISPSGQNVVLDSGKLKLTFNVSGGRLSLQGLAAADGREWLGNSGDAGSLWRLAFQGPEGMAKDLGSSDAILSDAAGRRDRADFAWTVPLAEQAAEVTMAVRVEPGNPISYWSLRAKLPDGWKVSRADFPIVPNIKRHKGLKMAVPWGWGLEYDVEPGTQYDGSYPSCQAAMQFLAFYHGGHGLYIGAHDVRGGHKTFKAAARRDNVGYLCMNWPALQKSGGGTYKVPFEAAIGVFNGDYYDAAQIYRKFTFKTPWGRGGPVSERPIPQWVKDTDLWLFSELTPGENLALYKKAADIFGIPISFHWYRWHEIPYDTLYPDYFPAKSGFAEAVRELQGVGWHVMPYINGRLSDPKSKFWTQQRGDKAAARRENGKPYPETYVAHVPLNVMCPYSAQWRQTVAGLVERLLREFGVDGVYIDQIGAAGPVRCFNPDHGHPLGGGTLWVDGYRKLVAEAREKLPKNAILATEENAECWIDQFDLQLMANTPTSEPEPIPLFPSVYSGRSLTFGFQYPAWDDIVKSVPFRAKVARSFVWGAQPGWVRLVDITRPEATKEAEFLRNVVRCRRFGHKFLVYGRFLGMLNVRGDNPRVVCSDAPGSFGGNYRIVLPCVPASAWLAEDGSLGVVLANMSDDVREVEFDLPLARVGISASKGFTIQTFGPEGLVSLGNSTTALQKLTIPGRGALIVSVSAGQREASSIVIRKR
ncbi:MAG TPA: DUF6259 domain-containing protein [Armatimonadota bacterium]|nr:DUF6259 domain-containing protein [Armatimonadota bacterium]